VRIEEGMIIVGTDVEATNVEIQKMVQEYIKHFEESNNTKVLHWAMHTEHEGHIDETGRKILPNIQRAEPVDKITVEINGKLRSINPKPNLHHREYAIRAKEVAQKAIKLSQKEVKKQTAQIISK